MEIITIVIIDILITIFSVTGLYLFLSFIQKNEKKGSEQR